MQLLQSCWRIGGPLTQGSLADSATTGLNDAIPLGLKDGAERRHFPPPLQAGGNAAASPQRPAGQTRIDERHPDSLRMQAEKHQPSNLVITVRQVHVYGHRTFQQRCSRSDWHTSSATVAPATRELVLCNCGLHCSAFLVVPSTAIWFFLSQCAHSTFTGSHSRNKHTTFKMTSGVLKYAIETPLRQHPRPVCPHASCGAQGHEHDDFQARNLGLHQRAALFSSN